MHERSKRLIALGKLKKETFLYRQIGLTHEVLFETKRKDSTFEGWTRNYARVNCTGDGLHNSFKIIKITDFKGDYLIGEIV
jgi:tRNA A37 methylthiotransferase MiaB